MSPFARQAAGGGRGGLLLLVEGTGRDPQSGAVLFNALATIAYDDAAGAYRFRAYNDGMVLGAVSRPPARRP